jgi:N-acetylglucosaminyl-diphospho-decaprenol L-rhamnosyltransferase
VAAAERRARSGRPHTPHDVSEAPPPAQLRASSRFGALSVIVVTYNSAAVLEQCLDSIAAHLPGAEVVVVDNGSRDDTIALARRRPEVRVVAGHGNVGFGAGVNRGAQAAGRGLLLVLNPDASLVAVDPAQCDRLRGAPHTGVVGCRVRQADGAAHDQRLVAWGWRAELYWALFQYFLVPREVAIPRPRLARPGSGRWIAGAGFVVDRDEFLEAGGFDETLFLYYEDFELCRRYRARGWPIRTSGALTIEHAGQRSSPRNERTMSAYALMSLIQYVDKWEGAEAARTAARRCLRLLRAVERIGAALRCAPVVGARAAKKRDEAREVRAAIAAIAARPPVEGAYAGAAAAVAGTLGTLGAPVG